MIEAICILALGGASIRGVRMIFLSDKKVDQWLGAAMLVFIFAIAVTMTFVER